MEGILQALTGFRTPETREPKEFETKEMTCCRCGRKSNDREIVSTFQSYAGGEGYSWREECRDLTECSKNW
jgi:hypothetical protein